MTADDIIRMAREIGFKASVGKTDKHGVYHPDINAIGKDVPIEWLERLVALAAAAEREACLAVAKAELPKHERFDDQRAAGNAARRIMAGIKARGHA